MKLREMKLVATIKQVHLPERLLTLHNIDELNGLWVWKELLP